MSPAAPRRPGRPHRPDRRGRADRVETEIGRRVVRLSSLGKVLWPATGFTKGGMIEYYGRTTPVLLPHLEARPVTLARYPDGVEEEGWYQTTCPHPPPWVPTQPVPSPGGRGRGREYCLVNEPAAVVWAANLGTIEFHPLVARADALARPTVVVFDLDPGPPAGIAACCRIALRIRGLLGEAGMACYAKTSGWNGVHVFAPVAGATYALTKGLARSIARRLASDVPADAVDIPARRLREGRVFIDWSQNDMSKSIVAPYSLRATPWPSVSMPLGWREVEETAARRDDGALRFGPWDVEARLDRFGGDPFVPVLGAGAPVPGGAGRGPA